MTDPADETPPLDDALVEAVTKAVLFADCGSTEDWQDNDYLGKAAIPIAQAQLKDKLAKLEAENARLQEALQFYATDAYYVYQPQCGCSSIEADGGDTAKIALGEQP